ncbi:ABC transporter ATP-binding protein/permease, partial [Candidatus Pelagibacter sp.]|nr:ABC transporter ATP-binding protein/permease [Candidatus Pelagibacter sp.]
TNFLLFFLFKKSSILGVTTVNQFLIFLGSAVFLLLIISLCGRALMNYAIINFALMREYSLGRRLIENYLHQPYKWFLNSHSAEIGKSILSEITIVIQGAFLPTMVLISQITVTTAIIILLIITDPKLAIAVSMVIGFSYMAIYLLVKNKLNKIGAQRLKANSDRFAAVSEAFSAFKEVKAGGLEKVCIDLFSKPAKIYAKNNIIASAIGLLPRYFLEGIVFGGMLLLILFLMVNKGNFEDIVPIIALYSFAGYRLMPALQQIYNAKTQIRFSEPALNNLHKDIVNLKKYKKPEIELSDFTFKEEISLKKINYNYPNNEKHSLKNIDLTIPAYSKIGIVGSTGSGKTTMVDLILGLLEPTTGTVSVDGRIINKENLRSWQNSIGYVPQQIFLSDTTITNNIAFGFDPEKIDQRLIERAAKIAQLHDFVVNELSNGYKTKIGERGVRLSGGQRQRIGIARALYKNPKLLIFDEATSALDNQTEQVVIEAINNLKNEVTIIFIAHRLNTVKDCDIIFKLEKGEIIDSGSFNEIF